MSFVCVTNAFNFVMQSFASDRGTVGYFHVRSYSTKLFVHDFSMFYENFIFLHFHVSSYRASCSQFFDFLRDFVTVIRKDR